MPPVSGVLDMPYLQSFEVVFFGQIGFEIRGFGSRREALWIFGKKGYEISQIWKRNSLTDIRGWVFARHEICWALSFGRTREQIP